MKDKSYLLVLKIIKNTAQKEASILDTAGFLNNTIETQHRFSRLTMLDEMFQYFNTLRLMEKKRKQRYKK